MGKIYRIIVLLILCFFIVSCAMGCFLPSDNPNDSLRDDDTQKDKDNEPADKAPDKTMSEFLNIPYGEHERQKLDIFLPKRLGALKSKIPFFMLIHGGSWTGGDKSDFYFLTQMLNEYGYAAVLINYRLIGSGAVYTDMLSDITAAFNLIKETGADYMLSTDKAALFGNSAGGHLALLYSYKINADSPIRIAFTVSQVGPTDFCDPDYYIGCGEEELNQKLELISDLTGENITAENIASDKLPEVLSLASPITYAERDFPPTLLAYGINDTLVPYSNGVRLYDKLRSINPSDKHSQIVIYKNSGHDLNGDKEALDKSLELLYQFSINYLPLPKS